MALSHFPSQQFCVALVIINNGISGIFKDNFFYCSFFTKVKKLRAVLYNESGKTLLLSGGAESNPGPITYAARCISSVATGRGVSDFLFN